MNNLVKQLLKFSLLLESGLFVKIKRKTTILLKQINKITIIPMKAVAN